MSIINNNIKENLTPKENLKVAIIKSAYNTDITDALTNSCREELLKSGINKINISVTEVPGAFELPFACQKIIKSDAPDVVIAIGAIIKGETPHFDFIASSTADGIMNVGLKLDTPIIFGVLTTNNIKQAKNRIKGGKRGDKGVEAAQTAILITS